MVAIAFIEASSGDQWGKARSALTGRLSTQCPAVKTWAYRWSENNQNPVRSLRHLAAQNDRNPLSFSLKWVDEEMFFFCFFCFSVGWQGKKDSAIPNPLKTQNNWNLWESLYHKKWMFKVIFTLILWPWMFELIISALQEKKTNENI